MREKKKEIKKKSKMRRGEEEEEEASRPKGPRDGSGAMGGSGPRLGATVCVWLENTERLPWGWGAKPSSSLCPKLSAVQTPRPRWGGRARCAGRMAPDFALGTCHGCP